MKWIAVSTGHYRLVNDDDERPAVKLRDKPGSPFFKYTPSWKAYEEGMKHQFSKDPIGSADKFIDERDHQLKTDPKAKRWEESRVKSWEKDKPQWRKEAMKKGII